MTLFEMAVREARVACEAKRSDVSEKLVQHFLAIAPEGMATTLDLKTKCIDTCMTHIAEIECDGLRFRLTELDTDALAVLVPTGWERVTSLAQLGRRLIRAGLAP